MLKKNSQRTMSALLLGLVLLSSPSCVPVGKSIPDGTYQNSNGEQKIQVKGREIEFDIISAQGQRLRQKYDYSVWDNGSMTFHPIVSSQYGVGVTAFEWYWNGQSIIQESRRYEAMKDGFTKRPGERTIFEKVEDHDQPFTGSSLKQNGRLSKFSEAEPLRAKGSIHWLAANEASRFPFDQFRSSAVRAKTP